MDAGNTATGESRRRRVRVWLGPHVIAEYSADRQLAEQYAEAMRRHFGGLRLTIDDQLTGRERPVPAERPMGHGATVSAAAVDGQPNSCPGCGGRIEQVVCCSRCWMRAPQHIGRFQRWRDKIRGARNDTEWCSEECVRDIHAELVYWLGQHPISYLRP